MIVLRLAFSKPSLLKEGHEMATLFPPTHGPHNFLKPFFNPPCSFSKSLSSWAPLRLGTVPLSLIHFSLRLRLLLSKAEMWRKRGMEGISKEGRKTERKSWPKLRHRRRRQARDFANERTDEGRTYYPPLAACNFWNHSAGGRELASLTFQISRSMDEAAVK